MNMEEMRAHVALGKRSKGTSHNNFHSCCSYGDSGDIESRKDCLKKKNQELSEDYVYGGY
jgi:hypothetical protein